MRIQLKLGALRMTKHNPVHLPLTILFGWACLALPAQEVTGSYGAMNTTDFSHSSYAYQLDYRQDFYRNLAASLTYINEGHVPGHHRDGYAVEAWGLLPTPHNRFSISLGLGAFFFYDTQASPGGGSSDVHGTAPILSLAGTGYLSNRWFYRLAPKLILPAPEMKADT